jgi:hypothetical protein
MGDSMCQLKSRMPHRSFQIFHRAGGSLKANASASHHRGALGDNTNPNHGVYMYMYIRYVYIESGHS